MYLHLSKFLNIPNLYINMYIIPKKIYKVNAHLYNPKKQSWTCNINVHVYNPKKNHVHVSSIYMYIIQKLCTCEFKVHVYNPKIKLLDVQINYNIYIYLHKKNNINNSLNGSPPLSSTRVFPWTRNNLQHV